MQLQNLSFVSRARLMHCNENLVYRLADKLRQIQTEFEAAEEYFINAILPQKRAFYQKEV